MSALQRFMTRPAVTKGPYGLGRVVLALSLLFVTCFAVLGVAGIAFAVVHDPSPTVQILRAGVPLALWWLVALAIGKIMFSMSVGDLISYRSQMRWGLFARLVGVAAVVFGGFWAFKLVQSGKPVVTSSEVVLALLVSLVAISLQASAEEIAFRGLGPQIVLGHRGYSTVRYWVVTAFFSVAFALVHGASTLAMFVFYVVMALILATIVSRTAGLEGFSPSMWPSTSPR